MPIYAQSLVPIFTENQESLSSTENSSNTTDSSAPVVISSGKSTSSSTAKCEGSDQTSIPLTFITSLLLGTKNLTISHDPRSGSLLVSSPGMISNCSSMIEWKLNRPVIEGSKAYAIEAVIKKGDNCGSEGCSYNVKIVENNELKPDKPMQFKPTVKGFEECLLKSGVVSEGKLVHTAKYPFPVNESFSGLDYSGKLFFQSHGPATPMFKSKYGKFDYVSGCDFYEAAHPEVKNLLTLEDQEQERLQNEANKLKTCKVDEYHKVADFLEKYEGFSSELSDVRDRLILEASKKSAKALSEGKYTDEDLKVLADFEKYIVAPKVGQASALYEETLELESDDKKSRQNDLKVLLTEIGSLNQKPYFEKPHVEKLINDGQFEDAEKINGIRLTLENYRSIGNKINGVVITPEVADKKIATSENQFSESMESEKERYAYRTGQESGNAKSYATKASKIRQNIQITSQSFTEALRLEYSRIQQPNGHCYKYWVNTPKCVQQSYERIQELQATLTQYNKENLERAQQYDKLAKEYNDLENQGRRYIAAQNNEEAPEDQAVPTAELSPLSPTPRGQTDSGIYSFDYQSGQGENNFFQQPNYAQLGNQGAPNNFQPQMSSAPNYMNQPYPYNSSNYSYSQRPSLNNWSYNGYFQSGNPYGQQQPMQPSFPGQYNNGQNQNQNSPAYWYRPYQAYSGNNFFS